MTLIYLYMSVNFIYFPMLSHYLQTETGALEFRNPKLERTVGLTPADRKWMDDILTDVNETWSESDSQPTGMHQYVTLRI